MVCESCGQPIAAGTYCEHCTDSDGNLQDFDTRCARMVAWQREQSPDTPLAEVEAQTRAHMATMPAWRDHPNLLASGGGSW